MEGGREGGEDVCDGGREIGREERVCVMEGVCDGGREERREEGREERESV